MIIPKMVIQRPTGIIFSWGTIFLAAVLHWTLKCHWIIVQHFMFSEEISSAKSLVASRHLANAYLVRSGKNINTLSVTKRIQNLTLLPIPPTSKIKLKNNKFTRKIGKFG
jgi:hypothetical protein